MKQASIDLSLSMKKLISAIPGSDEQGRSIACADRFDRTLPPLRQKRARPLLLATMLRTHFLQQWFTLADLGLKESFFDLPFYQELA